MNFLHKIHFNLEVVFSDSNLKLSSGEIQKIALARTFFKDSEIMIFDEPTAALDRTSKIKFIQCVNEIKINKIIIIVTHDEYI